MRYLWECTVCLQRVEVERKMDEYEIAPEDDEWDPRCCIEDTHLWDRLVSPGVSVSFSQRWGGKGKW